jgi:hypothetical protein
MLFYDVTLMASRFAKFAKREQYSQKLRDISTLRFQMRRNCQRYNVEGIPQHEPTQLQHPWYLSDFTYVYNLMQISIVFQIW